MSSSTVATVKVAAPDGPMVTVRTPRSPGAAKSPLFLICTITSMGSVGAGSVVTVKATSAPSITDSLPAWMLTTTATVRTVMVKVA